MPSNTTPAAMSGQNANANNVFAQNAAARKAVVSTAQRMVQQIYSATFTPSTQTVIPIVPQNVGLLLGFWVKIKATLTMGSSTTATLTGFGTANLLQNVYYTDLQNNVRVNTTGYHLNMLNSVRQGRPFCSSTSSDAPEGYGSNWTVNTAPATISSTTAQTLQQWFYIPAAYSRSDLTGAVYMGVVNATSNLQLTIPTSAQAAIASGDPWQAIYTGNTGTLSNVVVTVYQEYYDQLPIGNNGFPILPAIDLNTLYNLQYTAFTSFSASIDGYIGYGNFRRYLSQICVADNGGTYNTGSDLNYIGIQTANNTFLQKATPDWWAAQCRQRILTDLPPGAYLIDSRQKPVFTSASGNTNIVFNFSTVNSGCQVIACSEFFQNVQNLVNPAVGSLPATA